ncbi:cytochrome C biogenesis protein CcmI [Thalassospira sp. MA62]|nr:cytochrome C biogenesis protein CcmI [Thalassospira sp. MA62]
MIWAGLLVLAILVVVAIFATTLHLGDQKQSASDFPSWLKINARPLCLATGPVLIAVILYAILGNPTLPAKPYADRAGERNLAAAAAVAGNVTDPNYRTDQQIRRLLDQIVLSLEVNPRNLQGWVVLARGSLRLGDLDRAVAAFARAYALSGGNPVLAIEYADTRITAQNGQIDNTSRDLVLHALGQMPNHLLARYYYAMMLKQDDKFSQSMRVLADLIEDIPADDPLRNAAAGELEDLQSQLDDAD